MYMHGLAYAGYSKCISLISAWLYICIAWCFVTSNVELSTLSLVTSVIQEKFLISSIYSLDFPLESFTLLNEEFQLLIGKFKLKILE
jgi:hypothetical protein